MTKRKFNRVLAISMAFSMIFCSNVFATPIDVVNSTENVQTDTLTKIEGTDYFNDEVNEWSSGTINEEVRVKIDLASQFTVTIPKEIVLDGETGKADYKVKAVGDIAGDQVLSVVPDSDFALSEKGGKDDQTAIVTQQNTQYTYQELQGTGTEYDGNIAATLTAGEWLGKFNFNIEFKANSGPVLPAKASFNDMSWADIATVSEAGLASEYFNIGDEKELTIEKFNYEDYDAELGKTVIKTHPETTYRMQILGFNHDDKSDGTGKAGITVGLKECMATTHSMDGPDGRYGLGSNIGGWKNCEIRNYVNQNIYNALPQEVKEIIKPVDKLTSEGNKSIEIEKTSDRLFLFSTIEITGTLEDISPDAIHYASPGEGNVYEYYMKTKDYYKTRNDNPEFWWLRSPDINYEHIFCYIYDGVKQQTTFPIRSVGIVFGFCI